jgi:hypothetical protein
MLLVKVGKEIAIEGRNHKKKKKKIESSIDHGFFLLFWGL